MLAKDSVDLSFWPYHFLIVCDLVEFLLGRPYFEMFLDCDHSSHLSIFILDPSQYHLLSELM